jgi:mono/diheme cytochrome c family protein
MKRDASVVLFLMACWAQGVAAQQDGGGFTDTQLLGRRLLAQACGVCHLPVALNAKTYGPPLNKAATAGNDDVMRAFIVNGTPRMPAFKYHLQPAEIDAIIAYVRTVPAPPAASATR